MIITFLVNVLVVMIAVIIHYEFLYRISIFIPKMKIKHRYRIVFGVFGSLIAHVIEVWMFAASYFFIIKYEGWGELTGNFDDSFMDCVYFSFTVFTTVGFGDIEPVGDIRFLSGIESLTGLVLITWSASFLYFEMQRHWGKA